jgi:hypothetical protein
MWLFLPVHGQVFEIPYFPEVVFRGKPLTLHVRASGAEELLIRTNGVEYSRLSTDSNGFGEFTFFPDKAARLEVAAGEGESWSFAVVRPQERRRFTEQDGFLYVENTPVILLPDHKLPPPLDRRWETLDLVSEALLPAKRPISSIQAFIPRSSELLENLLPLWLEDRPIPVHPDEASWFHVHGFLTVFEAKPVEFMLIEIDLHDLERGMPSAVWLMKWQFLLQRLQAGTGYRDGILFGPQYDSSTWKLKPILEPSLISLARAHGLHFVDQSLATDLWQERLVHHLRKRYLLP